MTQATTTERPAAPVKPVKQRGMTAQFLRLKLRLLGNIFRRSPWQVVGISLGLVYGVGLATILFLTLVGLRFVDDVEVIRDVFTIVGAAVVVGFVIFPLAFGVDDTMDPRRFALFGLPDRALALGLACAAMIVSPTPRDQVTTVPASTTASTSAGMPIIAATPRPSARVRSGSPNRANRRGSMVSSTPNSSGRTTNPTMVAAPTTMNTSRMSSTSPTKRRLTRVRNNSAAIPTP